MKVVLIDPFLVMVAESIDDSENAFCRTARRRCCSVGRGAGLIIERLRNLGSTSDAVARRYVLGKDT